MYPKEFRERVVQVYKNEGNYSAVAKCFGIVRKTVKRWVHNAITPLQPVRPLGRPVRFDQDALSTLREVKEAHLDLNIEELAKEYARHTGESIPSGDTLSAALRKLGYSYRRIQSAQRTVKQGSSCDSKIPQKLISYRYKEAHRLLPENAIKRAAYPSDLSEEQWKILEPLCKNTETRGRKRKVPLREIINAIFYVLRTGCQWRYLPHDFPKWTLVAKTYYRLKESEQWERIHCSLREQTRIKSGREVSPSASIIDSQSTKTTEQGGVKGFDAGKKSKVESGISL